MKNDPKELILETFKVGFSGKTSDLVASADILGSIEKR